MPRKYELIHPRAKAGNISFRVPGTLVMRLAQARKEAEAKGLQVDISDALRGALERIVDRLEEEIAQWNQTQEPPKQEAAKAAVRGETLTGIRPRKEG